MTIKDITIKKHTRENLEKIEIATRILRNLQEIQKDGIIGIRDNRDINSQMINEKIDKLVDFICKK